VSQASQLSEAYFAKNEKKRNEKGSSTKKEKEKDESSGDGNDRHTARIPSLAGSR
jgi:hypothetical protein